MGKCTPPPFQPNVIPTNTLQSPKHLLCHRPPPLVHGLLRGLIPRRQVFHAGIIGNQLHDRLQILAALLHILELIIAERSPIERLGVLRIALQHGRAVVLRLLPRLQLDKALRQVQAQRLLHLRDALLLLRREIEELAAVAQRAHLRLILLLLFIT